MGEDIDTPACEYARTSAIASRKSIQATARAVQRITLTCSFGMHRIAIPPRRGSHMIIDKIGNMPLSPHCVVHNNQHYANQNCQGVVTHIASL